MMSLDLDLWRRIGLYDHVEDVSTRPVFLYFVSHGHTLSRSCKTSLLYCILYSNIVSILD